MSRAFAICLQEDPLLFYEVITTLTKSNEECREMISHLDNESKVSINIQVPTKAIKFPRHLIAVSLSDFEMAPVHFWNQK